MLYINGQKEKRGKMKKDTLNKDWKTELDAEVFRVCPQTNIIYFWHKILLYYKFNILY